MRPEESFLGQPVRSLQTMLRVIGKAEGREVSAIPDGIYGRQTAAAVSAFQREHGLPVTGVTDRQTWERLTERFNEAQIAIGKAQGVEVILNSSRIFFPGDSSPWVMLSQSMLAVIAQHYHFSVGPTNSGCIDAQTSQSLKIFQKLSGLVETGHLDRKTWKHLSLQFTLAANSVQTG